MSDLNTDGGIPINPTPAPAPPAKPGPGRPAGSRNRSTAATTINLAPHLGPLNEAMALTGAGNSQSTKSEVISALTSALIPWLFQFIQSFAAQHIAAHRAALDAKQAELTAAAGQAAGFVVPVDGSAAGGV